MKGTKKRKEGKRKGQTNNGGLRFHEKGQNTNEPGDRFGELAIEKLQRM